MRARKVILTLVIAAWIVAAGFNSYKWYMLEQEDGAWGDSWCEENLGGVLSRIIN